MHLKTFEIFCAVATRGSISKAAEAHGISQSRASQAIQELEDRLDLKLFDRSKRPLELTPAGQTYLTGCRSLLDGFRQIEDQVQRMKDKVTGRVEVAAIYSVGLLQMEGIVQRYQTAYPEVDLRLHYLHPEDVYDRVLKDVADLGLVSFPKVGGDLGCEDWQVQPMVFVVPGDHKWATRSRIDPNSLQGEKFVAFNRDLRIRRRVDKWFKEAKINVQIVHEFDNVENIKRAVEIGAGVALLPAPTVRRELSIGSLAALEPEGVNWSRPLGIIHKRNKSLTTAASKFVEILQAENSEPTGNAA